MNSSRRQFLVSCGRSAAILSAGPLLASCAAQAAASVRGFSETRLSDPLAARILAYASLASSGHNSQPWEVTLLESHHWRIGIPPERRLPAVDPLGRETLISLGAFLENLAQAAAVEGLHAEVKILSDESQCRDMVEVRLTAGASNSPVWLKRMQQRRVVKKGQLATKLRDDDSLAETHAATTGRQKGAISDKTARRRYPLAAKYLSGAAALFPTRQRRSRANRPRGGRGNGHAMPKG